MKVSYHVSRSIELDPLNSYEPFWSILSIHFRTTDPKSYNVLQKSITLILSKTVYLFDAIAIKEVKERGDLVGRAGHDELVLLPRIDPDLGVVQRDHELRRFLVLVDEQFGILNRNNN